MRGTLTAMEQLSRAIEKLGDSRMQREKIVIPDWALSKDLAWDFGGTVKYLEDCNKDELLYVCQVLCQQLKSVDVSEPIAELPSAA